MSSKENERHEPSGVGSEDRRRRPMQGRQGREAPASEDPQTEVAAYLSVLRAAAGEPSYAELVRRVMAQRMARGMSEWEARVGRTTVYDAFRPGRRMLDQELVAELVLALGGSEEGLAEHLERRRPQEGVIGPRSRSVLILACIAVNLMGRLLVNTTHMPLYLDMVGTAMAAIALGPWWGSGVGVATSLAGVATNGWISAYFIPVQIIGALIWGYGVHRKYLDRSVPRFFLLSLMVAISCSAVAVPIIVWIDRGVTGSGADQLTRSMDAFWHSLFAAVASQNLLTSVADKLISGFTALAIVQSIPIARSSDRGARASRSAWTRMSGPRTIQTQS